MLKLTILILIERTNEYLPLYSAAQKMPFFKSFKMKPVFFSKIWLQNPFFGPKTNLLTHEIQVHSNIFSNTGCLPGYAIYQTTRILSNYEMMVIVLRNLPAKYRNYKKNLSHMAKNSKIEYCIEWKRNNYCSTAIKRGSKGAIFQELWKGTCVFWKSDCKIPFFGHKLTSLWVKFGFIPIYIFKYRVSTGSCYISNDGYCTQLQNDGDCFAKFDCKISKLLRKPVAQKPSRGDKPSLRSNIFWTLHDIRQASIFGKMVQIWWRQGGGNKSGRCSLWRRIYTILWIRRS